MRSRPTWPILMNRSSGNRQSWPLTNAGSGVGDDEIAGVLKRFCTAEYNTSCCIGEPRHGRNSLRSVMFERWIALASSEPLRKRRLLLAQGSLALACQLIADKSLDR